MNTVNKENMYQLIKKLEGPRHALDNMDRLNETAAYLVSEFRALGYNIHKHDFKIKGLDETFTNITASLHDFNVPSLLVTAHYDTVRHSPGANDNLSGIAVMLETARIVSEMKEPKPIKFCAFSLEEGHPGFEKAVRDNLQEAGILDESESYHSLESEHLCKAVLEVSRKDFKSGTSYSESYKKQFNDLDGIQYEYAKVMVSTHEDFESEFRNNSKILTGSRRYVEALAENNIAINEVINYDCLGWIKKEKMTQKPLPITKEMLPLVKLNNVILEESRGDYLGIFSNMPAGEMLNDYLDSCKSSDVAYFGMHLPLTYDQIKVQFSDTLRSDHAPFWKAGIKAIFVSDFANFRSELYHTAADKYKKVDFGMLERIGNATVKYIMR
jgi:hypothetical protein